MHGDLDTKFLTGAEVGFQVKADVAGRPVTVAGYASLFSDTPDYVGDVVLPGAYRKTIETWRGKSYPLPMILDHYGPVIGRWDTLREDEKGLLVEGELTPGNTAAADTAASLKHGAISGLSIGYRALGKSMDDATGVRRLGEIDLHEISIVGRPAQETARVQRVKSARGCKTIREFEAWLREQGLSRREAEGLCEEGFKGLRLAREERDGGDRFDRRRDDEGAAVELLEFMKDLRRAQPHV
jgi:uncharacterized protein